MTRLHVHEALRREPLSPPAAAEPLSPAAAAEPLSPAAAAELNSQAASRASDPAGAVRAAELREAMGHFATGVTVVTSVDGDGELVGTTANAVTSLSLDPPLVLVCLKRASRTLRAARSHGAFAVNVLAARHRDVSAEFARRGGSGWSIVDHAPGRTGSPRLSDALASLECTVEHLLPGGDHEIIVGRVLDVATSDHPAEPLLYYRGAYASLERG